MMMDPGRRRRVIVGYDPTPSGHNALWHAVALALRHDAVMFIVSVHPSPRPAPWLPLPPVTAEQLHDDESARVTDSLLLAVGEVPGELDIRLAVLHGDPVRTLERLADRDEDVLIIPTPTTRARRRARRARHQPRAATLITVDPLDPNPRVVKSAGAGRRASGRWPAGLLR